MSTTTLPNIRVSSDLTVRVRLKDGGVAIDWSTLNNIKASIYSDAQRALAGRCDVSIDAEDSTLLVCSYAANKPQYVGVNRIVVSAKYMGETKTYDKPALNFVRWTSDQEGEELTIDDPDIDVEIDVEDVTSSILQNILDACIRATEEAREVVDVGRGPRGYSAYEVAVQDGYEGTEEEWLESLEGMPGPQGVPGIQGPVGPAGVSSAVVTVDNTTGTPSATASVSEGVLSIAITGIKGEQGVQGLKGDTGAKGDKGDKGDTGATGPQGPQGETGETGPQGPPGSPGITADDVEDVEDVEATLASVALRKTAQVLTDAEKTQVLQNLGLNDPQSGGTPQASAIPANGLAANVYYELGELSADLSVTLDSTTEESGKLNIYTLAFSMGATARNVTLPSVLWPGGTAPTFEAGMSYEIQFVNGRGTFLSFE